jgi:nitrate reductase gamma subunit
VRNIVNRHKLFWTQKAFLFDAFLVLFLLFVGFATYYANSYTAIHVSNSITDILLDNLPVVNVDFIYSGGALVFVILIGVVLLIEPRRIPFTLKSIFFFY